MAPFNKTTVENIEDLIRYHNAKQEKELKECHMARFMEDLSRPKIEGIYWTMTVLIILLAMAAGVIYSRTEKQYRAFKKEEKDRQDGLSSWAAFERAEQEHHQSAKICCFWAAVLLAMAIAADAIQVLAIIALQHCHHEALLGLYWPVWTLLGLGSSIAMAGVVLSQIYGLQQHELPPFGTALGTPVLVVCSIGHYIYTQVLECRNKKKNVSGTGSKEHLEKMVSVRTAACNSMRRSWENGPLLHFDVWRSNNDLPQNTEIIGRSVHGLLFTEPKCFDENCQTCSSRRNSEPSFVQAGTQTQDETNFPR